MAFRARGFLKQFYETKPPTTIKNTCEVCWYYDNSTIRVPALYDLDTILQGTTVNRAYGTQKKLPGTILVFTYFYY